MLVSLFSLSKKSSKGLMTLSEGLAFLHIYGKIEKRRVKEMLARKAEERGRYGMICIEEMVPKDHILRKIDTGLGVRLCMDRRAMALYSMEWQNNVPSDFNKAVQQVS